MLAETFPRVPNVSFFPQNVAAPRKLPKSNWILTKFSFHLLKVNFTWNSSEYLPRKKWWLKCDSANERLLVKRGAGGRQLTIVPDITFFTQHHCTDIAPTNTQWEQSKTMFLPTSSFICDEEKSFILWLSLNFAFVVANLFSKVVKLKYKAMASKFYKWVALKASLQGNAR